MYEVKMMFEHGWENVWNDTVDGVVTPVLFEDSIEAMIEILDVVRYSNGAFTVDDFKVEKICIA